MAIDTAPKRRNVSALMPPFGVGVTPDAAKPLAWRQAVGWGYLGITAGASVVLDLRPPYTAYWVNPSRSALFTDPSRTAAFTDPDRTALWQTED